MRRMKRRTWLQALPLSVLLPAGVADAMERAFLQAPIGSPNAQEKPQGDAMPGSAKVYELRIYHVLPGKLDSLVARFRDHTDKLFAKHGMKSVAYWTALDEPVKSSTFFYILEHPSRDAAAANWKAFQDDQEWKTVKAKSEENGKLVEKIDATFLTLTDFPSPQRI
jgi:NIPSNAP